MIEVKFTITEDSCVGLTMEGHAGCGRKGEDIVCSAASILAYTVAQTVAHMAAQGKLLDAPKIVLEPGNCYISAKPGKDTFYEVFHAFFVVQVGYSLLATRYPDNVKLESFA